MEIDIPLPKESYSSAMLKVMNSFLMLTDYELDIISKMLNNKIVVLNSANRAKIRSLTGKSVGSTNNYIKKLKDKKMLVETSAGLQISDKIMKPIHDKEVTVRFHVDA